MLLVVKSRICFYVLTTALLLLSFCVSGQEPGDSIAAPVLPDTTLIHQDTNPEILIQADTASVVQSTESEAIIISDTTDFVHVFPLDTSMYAKHSPAKAAIMSAVVPGLGQVYNKKYWKIPIVYAAIGTSVFIFLKWQNKYSQYRRAYIDFNDQDPYTNYWKTLELPSYYTTDQISQTVSRGKDLYRGWRDWAIVAMVASYALTIIDANVDAHLLDFSIDDDISLNIRPCFLSDGIKSQKIGLNLHFTF